MRPKKPRQASIEEVRVLRDGEYGVIDYADPAVGGMRIHIGPDVANMSDAEILQVANDIVASMEHLRATADFPTREITPGRPQIDWFAPGGQWVPRGEVLRCMLSDDEDGKLVVYVDDTELDEAAFCRMLRTYAGWGMRITFVDESDLAEQPEITIVDPDDET